MKQFRPLLLVLPLMLTGCSTLSSMSWSSLSPFNWFGDEVMVTEQGVGKISASTAFNEDAIDEGLGGGYRLRGGAETRNGSIVNFYEALSDNTVRLTLYGKGGGRVEQVVVADPAIPSATGIKIGTPFSALYSKAFGACQKGDGAERDSVVCAAPQSGHISYVFSGSWHGPDELMPSDDALKSWKVSKIIWHSAANPA